MAVHPLPASKPRAKECPPRLGICAGVHKPARVALYGVDSDEGLDSALYFEAVAEFDSFKAAATAIRTALAEVEAFWRTARR